MGEPAAKKDDKIVTDGTSKVWVQPPGTPPPAPKDVTFDYEGPIDNIFSSNVYIMGKPAATVGSTATNSIPPNIQSKVTSVGTVINIVNNTATITTGSSTVYINGKKAVRNEDKAKTWNYPSPSAGSENELENANVKATGSVYMGD